jgi:Ca2+-binding EF-hand superfamily protein
LLVVAAPTAFAQASPPTDDEAISAMFARMDSDRDGQVSLEEFEAGIRRPYGAEREGVVYQKLPARFRVLDADGDGFLEASEYARLGERWQLPGSPPALALADRNRDGRIDFREFALLHAPHEATAADAGTAAR